jgi:FkbH-like protein
MNKLLKLLTTNTSNLSLKEINALNSVFTRNKDTAKYKRKINLGIISDYNVDYLKFYLPFFFFQKKIDIEITIAPYGSLSFFLRDKKNDFWKKKDLILIVNSYKSLNIKKNFVKENLFRYSREIASNWCKSLKFLNCPIIQTTFDAPPLTEFNYNETIIENSISNLINLINFNLIKFKSTNNYLVDIKKLHQNEHKRFEWNNLRMLHLAKQPFDVMGSAILSKRISNVAAEIFGLSKKVLVIDLDNTIWGGIIGDIGFKNISIGPENSISQAYMSFQHYIKNLSDHGITICVCSKNDERIAKEPFLKNKNMILKLDDISLFVANYNNKGSNIRNIAKSLNLSEDSLVFVDDNIIECNQVRKMCPEVMTIHLGNDPLNFIDIIDSNYPFYLKEKKKEDNLRKKNYQNIEKFQKLKKENSNIETYLKSLRTKCRIFNPDKNNTKRTMELFAKTNQFRFNDYLPTQNEIIKNNKNFFIGSLKDKFQEYGIIFALKYQLNKKEKKLKIINWTMSCRVFSRKLEHFIFDHLIKIAKNQKLTNIEFKFNKTEKNKYLQIFLDKHLKLKNISSKSYLISIDDKYLSKKKFYIKLDKSS